MDDSTARRWRPRRPWVVGGVAALLVAGAAAVVIGMLPPLAASTPTVPDIPSPTADGIGGYLFQDRDGDGEHGAGEPVLTDWEVRVYSTGPLPLEEAVTDGAGVFSFPSIANLTPGEPAAEIRVQPVLDGPAAAGLPRPSALSQSFAIPLGETRAIPVAAFRSCLSPAECPGLELPDLVPQLTGDFGDDFPPPTETHVDTTTEPGRVLLRFATSTANLGGVLHVTGAEVSADGESRAVTQRVYGDGVVLLHGSGEFVYHPEHRHFHLDEFERYELLSADRSTVLATSGKVSFCLTDVLSVDPPDRSDGSIFLDLPPFDCGAEEQGINQGYADYYGAELDDQWIDVTGVPSGEYWVRLTVDPEGVLLESDRSNNVALFPVTYTAP